MSKYTVIHTTLAMLHTGAIDYDYKTEVVMREDARINRFRILVNGTPRSEGFSLVTDALEAQTQLLEDRKAETYDRSLGTWWPATLFPHDYLDEDNDIDRDMAFELAEKDTVKALSEARNELAEILPNHKIRAVSCEFEQFDSGNIYHAGAHFVCKMEIEGMTYEEYKEVFNKFFG